MFNSSQNAETLERKRANDSGTDQQEEHMKTLTLIAFLFLSFAIQAEEYKGYLFERERYPEYVIKYGGNVKVLIKNGVVGCTLPTFTREVTADPDNYATYAHSCTVSDSNWKFATLLKVHDGMWLVVLNGKRV